MVNVSWNGIDPSYRPYDEKGEDGVNSLFLTLFALD